MRAAVQLIPGHHFADAPTIPREAIRTRGLVGYDHSSVSCPRLSHAQLLELQAYSDLDSFQEELQKIGIYLVGIGCHHTVRKARVDL